MGRIVKWIVGIVGFVVLVAVLAGAIHWAMQKSRQESLWQPLEGKLVLGGNLPAFRSEQLGAFVVSWDSTAGGSLQIEREGRRVWETVPGKAFVGAGIGRETVQESRGSFHIEDELSVPLSTQGLEVIGRRADTLILTGFLLGDQELATYQLSFFPSDTLASHLHFHLKVTHPEVNRCYLTYGSRAGEHFFGFGEQFSHFDLKGKRVPIFVMEQGIGRGAQPLTFLVDLVAQSGGNAFSTYAAVPHYISSDLRSLALDNYEASVFDLRQPHRVQVKVFSGRVKGRIIGGASPQDLIRNYSAWAGRMRVLPDWIHRGAVVGMQGGTEKVREVYRRLKQAGASLAGFWLQDWVGQRRTSFGKQLWWNWELDTTHYPGWDSLRADLQADSLQLLLYFNPFLVDVTEKGEHGRNLFKEAEEQGFLTKDSTGAPFLIPNTSFSAGLLDLSNPAAMAWMKEVIRKEVLSTGAKGWMADFGEALPYEAKLYSGEAAASYHNHYPEAWARLNREVLEETPEGKDRVFFTRSGYTRSPRFSTLFWLGDQMVSWDAHDGIKTAVTGLLSSGISGYSLNHSDIGGYTTITDWPLTYRRSRELLLRWMELNAFTAVFRSHEGNRPEENVQVYDDSLTLAHFARFSGIYAALAPYRKALVAEAAASGMPVVRHPWLHYPDDSVLLGLSYEQFMLGPDLMVAPVLDAGVDKVSCYLPEGSWIHLWSREQFRGGEWVEVPAPLGEPGVFVRQEGKWSEQLLRDL